ncbi:hypothetical protein NLI96_g12818 [Meripilus lineatus]|uniref:Uncharacterized protein n=1 Tax=Meripilus lineatus TaxID=2056292 RepID=A0AAD5YC16_9APHY|nr:hypothetical protein NLI96_g12818 [Physisporinus lineatus]
MKEQMTQWCEEHSLCRRSIISKAMDGVEVTCTTLPDAIPCDVCDPESPFGDLVKQILSWSDEEGALALTSMKLCQPSQPSSSALPLPSGISDMYESLDDAPAGQSTSKATTLSLNISDKPSPLPLNHSAKPSPLNHSTKPSPLNHSTKSSPFPLNHSAKPSPNLLNHSAKHSPLPPHHSTPHSDIQQFTPQSDQALLLKIGLLQSETRLKASAEEEDYGFSDSDLREVNLTQIEAEAYAKSQYKKLPLKQRTGPMSNTTLTKAGFTTAATVHTSMRQSESRPVNRGDPFGSSVRKPQMTVQPQAVKPLMSAKALGKQPAYRQSATAASGSNRLDQTHQYSMGGFRKRKASELEESDESEGEAMNEGEFKQVLSQPGPLSQPRQRSSPLAHKSGPGPHRNLTSFQARDRGHPYQRNAAPREPSPEE